MAEDTTLDLVKNKLPEFSDLWKRMDRDAEFVNHTKYSLVDSENKPIPRVVNVTMNHGMVFANTICSAMMRANMQTVIKGNRDGKPMPDKATSLIESFLEANYAQIDDRLIKQFISLDAWESNHVNVRGWICGRYLARIDNGFYMPDFAFWDARYVTFEMGLDDIYWTAYQTIRSKSAIKAEYDIDIRSSEIEVTDFWNDTIEEVWLGNKKAPAKPPHNLGYVPVVIQPVASGFMLRDKGYLKYEGESLFMLVRDLEDELSRSVSIEQTIALKTVLPPYQKPVADMGGEPAPYPDRPGQVTEILQGEEYRLLEVKDINNAQRMAHADIWNAIQQGSLSTIDLGNMTFPVSAVAISAITEIRDKVFIPRLQARAMFRQQLSRMIIDQYKAGGVKAEIGTEGHRQSYSPQDLEGDYSIRYRFMSKDKKQEIANLAMAGAAHGILPEKVIIRDILMSDNPDEVIAQLASEKAEQADPVILLFRLAHACIDDAETLADEARDAKLLESIMLTERAVSILGARNQPPASSPPEPEPQFKKPSTQALVSLLGERGVGGRPRQEQRLEETER